MEFLELIECTSRRDALKLLFASLVRAAAHEGFSYVAYSAVNYEPLESLDDLLPPVVALSYPKGWYEVYVSKRYFEIDPILMYAKTSNGPLVWSALQKRRQLSHAQLTLFREAAGFGLVDGISLPLFSGNGQIDVVSFASNRNRVFPRSALKRLTLLGRLFHEAATCFCWTGEPRSGRLSGRERECLEWVAQGKSTWEISRILGITERTVKFHVNNAMNKLGSSTRMVAVIRAAQRRLIDTAIDSFVS